MGRYRNKGKIAFELKGIVNTKVSALWPGRDYRESPTSSLFCSDMYVNFLSQFTNHHAREDTYDR